jgi:hypothetical protein
MFAAEPKVASKNPIGQPFLSFISSERIPISQEVVEGGAVIRYLSQQAFLYLK